MNVPMRETAGGLLVPADVPAREVAPPIICEQGVPVTLRHWEMGELFPMKGYFYQVVDLSPWGVILQLRAPTPKTLKKLKAKKANAFGDVSVEPK